MLHKRREADSQQNTLSITEIDISNAAEPHNATGNVNRKVHACVVMPMQIAQTDDRV